MKTNSKVTHHTDWSLLVHKTAGDEEEWENDLVFVTILKGSTPA